MAATGRSEPRERHHHVRGAERRRRDQQQLGCYGTGCTDAALTDAAWLARSLGVRDHARRRNNSSDAGYSSPRISRT